MIYPDNTVTSAHITCNRCKKDIIWRSDEDTGGPWNTLRNHLKNDIECIRIQKLAEIFDEKTDLLGCQKFFIK